MLRSIRWTLQLWHAGILALALAGFGTAAYYGISRARYKELDSELERTADVLSARLRGVPNRVRIGVPRGPEPDRRPPDGERRPPDGERRPESDRRLPDPDRPPPDVARMPQDGPRLMPDRGPGERPQLDRGPGDRPPPDRLAMERAQERFEADRADREQEWTDILFQRLGEERGAYFIIWRPGGELMFQAGNVRAGATDPGPPTVEQAGPPPPAFVQFGDVREAVVYGSFAARMRVGRSIAKEQQDLTRFAWLLAATGAGVLTIGLAGGWVLSARVVRPIRAISDIARTISASNLSRRIDVAETHSELGTLAQVLNETFARLDAAFQQQVRFTADASHELRTPLAVIHSNAELSLSRERSPEEYRRTLEKCLRATSRMKSLVDSLLLLARADAGKLEIHRRRIDLAPIAEECIALVASLADERGISLHTDFSSAEVTADPSRLPQVLINLLTNAIRYNKEGGSVRVSIRNNGVDAILTVSDTGIGIAEEDREHVFERFYRADKARGPSAPATGSKTREAAGSGLGLAISQTIVEGHGGTISFTSEIGTGTTFTVRLPRASSAPA